MNVDAVLDTVEQTLLSRQLSSLERFILCQSWGGRGYSEMAPDCAYSIAHIKDIGSQLWQALSKALGERVTKKNLFLVLKQYLLSRTDETVTSDQERRRAQGRRLYECLRQEPTTLGSKGIKPPVTMLHWLPEWKGLNPLLNGTFCPLPPASCLLQPLSVTLELVEAIDPPLTPTTHQLPVTTDFVEASYSEDSEQLPRGSDQPTALLFPDGSPLEDETLSKPSAATARATRTGESVASKERLRSRRSLRRYCYAKVRKQQSADRCELVTEESSLLERVQQEYQTSCDNTEAENNLKAPVTQSEPTIPSGCLPLGSPLYINRPPIAELTYAEMSQPRCLICIKVPKLPEKSSLLSRILTRTTASGYKTVYLDFQEADVTVSAELNQFLGWLRANLSRQLNFNF
jgi:hypothetical protein